MKTLRKLLLCVCFSILSDVYMAKAASTVIPDIQASSSPKVQEDAVRNLIRRLLPFHSESFKVKVDLDLGPKDQDTFELKSVNGSIQVSGSSGVAAAWGFHYYLKIYCGCHVSWSGVQLKLPKLLPQPETPVLVTSNDKFTYYMNVCTFSYSTVWWNWTRWEKELDWMALNRINLPLAFVGQEIVLKRVFLKLGFEEKSVDDYITGPAFLAWNRMGNIQQFGGPLPSSWHQQQLRLQHQILNRMREFGMFPVLPAFSGHVPSTIKELFPTATVSVLAAWSHFGPPYSGTTFLEPSDPLFRKIGAMFLQEVIMEIVL
ncbi:alpha-N-acetylglucosaminidase-like isoform X2 [Limulus polyphemus]|uniref:Alpha-N-acetylglucosaminidase-like isoform X2 n=1 Tax=Limulus polyphemus TaxID=6850 RepID=A0ABM1TSL6_LIMPO|nr:alpha-N-acetylglucosaminidase-like isoform X2 [Limulus polyphemus]